MPHADLTPTWLGIDHETRAYARDGLIVVVPSSDAGFDAVLRFVRERASARGEPSALLVLIRPGIRGDALRVREQSRRLLVEGASCLACVAYVIDGRGFFASIFMSMASGVFLHVADAPTPMKAFGGADEACGWMSPYMGGPPWLASFVEAVREDLQRDSLTG